MAKINDYVVPNSDGTVRGDDHPMPYRKEADLAPSNAADDGADLGPDATNTIGKISRATQSDNTGDA